MKNYNKKLIIMFVMLLAIIGFGTIQNGTTANAATVGQVLAQPEDSWRRYDDTDSRIVYGNNYSLVTTNSNAYNSTYHSSGDDIDFKFYGTKLRIISSIWSGRSKNVCIQIDNITYRYDNGNSSSNPIYKTLVFEKLDLSPGVHIARIYADESTVKAPFYNTCAFEIDAIDIDTSGQLIQYNESIDVDKSSIDVSEGDQQQLKATTTPAGLEIVWSSSDESVAKVDQNGNVTAVGEGTCTITATINDGSNLSDSCIVNVAKKDTTEPTEPDNTKALLIINLTDGETKVFDVTNSEVSKFKQWYNTKSEFENKLTYEFNKTVNSSISVEEDVVHDQITSYEIRKY